MRIIRISIFVLLAFALHLGCTALLRVGWPPQPLIVFTILAVWRADNRTVAQILLPAALLVDLVQAVQIPTVTLTIAVVWLVAALIQRQWLTNHSTASLLGLTVVGLGSTLCLTVLMVWLVSGIGASGASLGASWSGQNVLTTYLSEGVLILLLGNAMRIAERFFGKRFFYVTHKSF